MPTPLELAAHRFSAYAHEVIRPAVFSDAVPLEVAAWQCADPVSVDEARAADFRPVAVGWRWGPAWSTAWFRVTGRVPASFAGRTVAVRFSSGTEALLWDAAGPRQGFDVNRDTHVLHEPARGDEPVELLIEAACNHPFGTTSFSWDTPETRDRWSGDTPGRLERCELAVLDRSTWRLWRTYELAQQLLKLLPEDNARAHGLAEALRRATQTIDDRDVPARADEATAMLRDVIGSGAAPSATRCTAVGHAHIDTAWLWPIRETRRKCLRSFANVLGLMDRYPDFRFLCSQAQQYAWVEEDAPSLFERIAARVREGRWEPAGAMWVEPDCNVPSGESLVRQVIHGTRYWRDRFGADGRQRLLYLPDTFGFTPALPQIMALSGLDTFVTNKLAWNQVNEFPFMSFRWRGLDGTEVLAHCTPGHDYNATNTPEELRRGEGNAARKDEAATGLWLQPFGYGDGGGGPTEAMIVRADLAADSEGLPRVTMGRAGDFCDELHDARARLVAAGRDLPVWDGELYLELHRGTLTTQSWLKRANRRAEHALRIAEWLSCAAPVDAEVDSPADLDDAWKLLLLNQFHDILPGSSIGPVYTDARRDHERIDRSVAAVIERGLERWAGVANTTGLDEPMLVFNPGSAAASAVVEYEGILHPVEDVPPLGVRVVDRASPPATAPVSVETGRLANGIIEARIDDRGRITSLVRARDGREACAAPLNQLVQYEDRPASWDAWDIDAAYTDKPFPVDTPAERTRIDDATPLRGAIEIDRPLGDGGRITQRFVLDAGSPRLDIQTTVDWRDRRRLLKTLFPVDVRARRATCEVQFGHIERPTHRNTTWEQVMFEFCAHSWMDLAEPGFGVALLNDGKYGHSCHDSTMGLTLLRAPAWPDPEADLGEHVFTYSVMLHDGDWRAAGVDHQATLLNTPLMTRALSPGRNGTLARTWSPVTLRGAGAEGVIVTALKPAESGEGVVLRLVETHGRRAAVAVSWHLPIGAVEPVDLLEAPRAHAGFRHDATGRISTISLRPFQLATLIARPG